MKKSTIEKPFWIIRNDKKNAIWKQPYLSKIQAEAELKYQLSIFPTAIGWYVEEHKYWGNEDGLEDF